MQELRAAGEDEGENRPAIVDIDDCEIIAKRVDAEARQLKLFT